MKKLAIVGTGISGMTAAYLLCPVHDITVFEADHRVGGHTHTHEIDDPHAGPLAIDTGFIVFNDWTYPNFIKLLSRLGVASQPSEMSFSVRCERTGLEYAGNSINTLFAQRRNLLRPRFYRMIVDIARFYRDARRFLADSNTAAEFRDPTTLRRFLDEHRYSPQFIDLHLIPIGASIWSADPQQFFEFPARYLFRFFDNHGMLNIRARPTWRVIQGGSAEYVRRLTAPFADRIRLAAPVERILRHSDHVTVAAAGHADERFDEVVIAAHSDQALRMLADPAPAETDVLGAIRYQRNETVLHTDTSLMPRRRRAWSAWNYLIPAGAARVPTLSYNMNILQSLPLTGRDPRQYLVSLNTADRIDPATILRRMTYHHPAYNVAGVLAQQRWSEISGVNRTHYCGAYWGFGFHEDGVISALRVAEAFGKSL